MREPDVEAFVYGEWHRCEWGPESRRKVAEDLARDPDGAVAAWLELLDGGTVLIQVELAPCLAEVVDMRLARPDPA